MQLHTRLVAHSYACASIGMWCTVCSLSGATWTLWRSSWAAQSTCCKRGLFGCLDASLQTWRQSYWADDHGRSEQQPVRQQIWRPWRAMRALWPLFSSVILHKARFKPRRTPHIARLRSYRRSRRSRPKWSKWACKWRRRGRRPESTWKRTSSGSWTYKFTQCTRFHAASRRSLPPSGLRCRA